VARDAAAVRVARRVQSADLSSHAMSIVFHHWLDEGQNDAGSGELKMPAVS